jgi:GR25 family glycosyltransferase involved in LPS biosynthesis
METTHEGTTHEGTIHEETTHEGTTHEGTIHEETTHEGTTHEETTHEGTIHEETTHEGTTHEETTHEGTTHEGTTHEETTHDLTPEKLFENTHFINLEHRIDRLYHVKNELSKMNIIGNRFNAVKTTDGAVGCSISHLKCLEMAKKHESPFVFICEDDIQFLNPTLFLKQVGTFCQTIKSEWDVLIVSGNICPPYQQIGDYCVRLVNCQTTTGYIVQQHYYDKLIENYKESIKLLLSNPANKREYAIDIYWKRLQVTDRWYMITPPTVVQVEGFSDVEGRNTNYKHLMTDMNKEWLFKQRGDIQFAKKTQDNTQRSGFSMFNGKMELPNSK